MGDMKTPDFDDLLAAFDIPDGTGLDAKEPIQESQEDTESQLKHTGVCLDGSQFSSNAISTADVPIVSVIVKNTSRQNSLEGIADHTGTYLHNGYRGQDLSTDTLEMVNSSFPKSFVSALNGEILRELPAEAPLQHKPDGTPASHSLSHFSPVSSPESEHSAWNWDETCLEKGQSLKNPSIPQNTTSETSETSKGDGNETEKLPSDLQNSTKTKCDLGMSVDASTCSPRAQSQTSQFSSCLEALVALNAGKDASEQLISRESSSIYNDCIKASSKVPKSPGSPRSPLETVKQLMRPSDSPVSLCSYSSGKASPALTSGSSPAIPRVRIKTIKTTSGRIKRTATSVIPDSETDEVPSTYESSPAQSIISEDSYWNVSPQHSQTADSHVGMLNKANSSRTFSPEVINRSSEENHGVSAKKLSSTVLPNTGGPLKRAATTQVPKPKKASATAAPSSSTHFLPKAMHLASLNLVPHSVAASVAARSASIQQSQHTLSPPVCSTVPLVHQVKAGIPAGGSALNRLLHQTNPVPVYVPSLSPPSDSMISLPPHGYRCLECGDSFAVERSLAFHYSRRSVHIDVRCAHCAKTLVFFNKCALWAHAREHKNNGITMQCTQMHVSPLPVTQMFVPVSSEPVPVSTFTSPLLLPPPSPQSEPVLPLYQDNVNRHPRCCLECSQQLVHPKALAGHFQRLSGDVEKLVCKTCSMLLPNKCSFKAHQRIHAHKSPYCCPECGAVSGSADIQKHVKENCLHYARKAWYKCLHCDTVFKTLHCQKTHIDEKHCEVVHKCSICAAVFKTMDGCVEHLKSKHRAVSLHPKAMFRCSCQKMFKKKMLLYEHFNQNANKRLSCIFKCPECNSVFSQKILLMQHFKGVHAGQTTTEVEPNGKNGKNDQDQDLDCVQQQKSSLLLKCSDKKPELNRTPRVKLTCWTCGECLQRFPDRDSFVAHMKASHRKPLKKFPCRYCEKTFKSATSMKRHIRSEHNGNKRMYTCWYCTDTKKTFTTSVTLKNHISLMHGVKNPDLSKITETTTLGSQTQSHSPTAGPELSSDERVNAQFNCLKCGFTTDDDSLFQQHIPQHKMDEHTPQCLNCGLAFTSKLSLSRHLFIVHKVKGRGDACQEKAAERPSTGEASFTLSGL
uniref:C2H2-type domain-containing protein n=1 Tax=Gouania willdenowi TaxID=441366 RepID=A0A8C5GSN3_GOUWI